MNNKHHSWWKAVVVSILTSFMTVYVMKAPQIISVVIGVIVIVALYMVGIV